MKSGDKLISLKETCGPCERRAEQHYYITVRLKERATWKNEIGLRVLILLIGIFHVPGWLVSSALDSVEGRAWTAHTAIVSRECFQYSSLSVSGS